MMNPKFGKPVPSGAYVQARTDLDQMPETRARAAQHRRAHSETLFRFPDLDDILVEGVLADFDGFLPNGQPPPPLPAQPDKSNEPKTAEHHLRSLSVDADFFEGLVLDAPPPPASGEPSTRPRHRHSNSMDGYYSATSFEVDFHVKKAMAADRLAELALIDPKRAKRILANRQSAARSKERKTRYTNELERKAQTLQSEATTLSAQITLLQRDTTGLTAENKELRLKLQALEQQAHLKDALNEALRNELQWLKITAGQISAVNGNSKGSSSQTSSQPPTISYFGNRQGHQQQLQLEEFHTPHSSPNNPRLSPQSQPNFPDFNHRV